MSVYHEDWKESGKEGMLNDFGITEKDIEGAEIIFATYLYEDYSGNAFVLFRKDNELYEVNGGHCSCFGLEDQWKPEQTTKEALEMRKFNFAPEDQVEEIRQVLA